MSATNEEYEALANMIKAKGFDNFPRCPICSDFLMADVICYYQKQYCRHGHYKLTTDHYYAEHEVEGKTFYVDDFMGMENKEGFDAAIEEAKRGYNVITGLGKEGVDSTS